MTTEARTWDRALTALPPTGREALIDEYGTALGDEEKAGDGEGRAYHQGRREAFELVLDMLSAPERDVTRHQVEVLHQRDPDSGCEIDVYVDGTITTDVTLVSVDPGVGHSLTEWNASTSRIETDDDLTDGFREAASAAYQEAADSSYIGG